MPFVLAAVAVLVAQGLLMLVDEFVFHRRREIPRWELVGHPLDTLSVLAPLILALLAPHGPPWTAAFVGLAVFSCVFVTKDEAVHARLAAPGEHWLHALLFMLHPMAFTAVWFLWKGEVLGVIALQALLVSGFLVWQLWSGRRLWIPR